jgi:sn-glycerol 3-phosphate transport system substrate-binding protein
VDFCNPGNGRGSDRATSVTMTSPTQIAFLTELQKLFEDGAALNPGTISTAMPAAFNSGDVGMLLTSSGSYTTLKNSGVQVDVAAFPYTAASPAAGAAIGGASLWIDGPGHSGAEQQAAYQFAKFLESAPSQAAWSKATGYLMANSAGKETADGKATLADPNVAVMYKELTGNPASTASAGCRTGAYPAVRTAIIGGFNKAIAGTAVMSAMSSADQQADQAITQYNAAVK